MEKIYLKGEEIERDGKVWVVTETNNLTNELQTVIVNLKTKKGIGKTMASFWNDRPIAWKKSRV